MKWWLYVWFEWFVSKVFAEVSAESKYSIGCLVVYLFILYLENEE